MSILKHLRSYGRRGLNALVRTPDRLRASRVAKRTSRQTSNRKTIVFVTKGVQVRVCKLARALKLLGYEVVLLHAGGDFGDLDSYVVSLFDDVVTYISPEDAVIKAAAQRPVAYHVMCNWDYSVAKTFVRMRPGVVVVDTKDVLRGFVRPHVLRSYPFQEQAERFCLQNADGICCSDLRTQYLKQHLGYRLPPRLFWPDYCWPVGFTKRHLTKMEGRHVAYVGSLEADPRSPVAVVYDLARLLAETGINFHIYPSYTSHVRTLRQEIGQVVPSDLLKYVHVHDTVRFQDLTRELSAFHAGILVSNKSVNYGEKGDTYYPIMGEYFLASKLFDYHEAGLPCVTQQMRVARHMFPRDGAFREVRTLQEVADVVSQMDVCQIEVHPKRRLDHHAHRLAEFYLRLYRQRAASTRR
jgi:hypothetical protein